MKKKSFVLSWGRKMFFGMGWALTCVVALTYFQSMIVPQTFSGWAYFLTTFIGHYGLILSLVYFGIYTPVVYIFPSYYVARIWSVVLILAINALIFFDSYLFSHYRFHLNSFLIDLIQDQDALTGLGFTSTRLGLIGFVTLILFAAIWLRGEKLWRSMQARFSNPVKNWYLVLILICFVSGQLLYSSQLSNLFPMSVSLLGKDGGQGYKDFYYPSKALNCSMKQPKNILLIVLDKWSSEELNITDTPSISHFSTHGLIFNNHLSGGLNKNDGYFSLLYSLPPTYAASVLNQPTEPVFLTQMKQAKMEANFFQTGGISPMTHYLPKEKEILTDYIESQLAERDELAVVNPFFMHVFLGGGSLLEKDQQAKTIIDLFIQHQQTNNTIIVLTGGYSDELKTPLIVIWPGMKPATISKLTSHYDVLPSIMLEDWRCKNSAEEFSYGKNIFTNIETDTHVAGNYQTLKIWDDENQIMTTLDAEKGVEGNDQGDVISTLNVLQDLTRFYKR